jgi:hypothetical protein
MHFPDLSRSFSILDSYVVLFKNIFNIRPIYIFELSVCIFVCGLFQLTFGIHMLVRNLVIGTQDFSSVRLHTQGMTGHAVA